MDTGGDSRGRTAVRLHCGSWELAHFHATEHPIVRLIEPGEDWRWCCVDECRSRQ